MRYFPVYASLRRVPFLLLIFLLVLLPVTLFADDEPADQPPNTEQPAADQPDGAERPADDQTATPSTDEAADVVVTATRTEERGLNLPQFTAVLTQEEIEKTGLTDVAKIIARETGITIYEMGPAGSTKQIWMRGAKGSRVLILLDGVPINNANDGVMDLSLVPVSVIDRIEIVFGGASVMYGSNALNGAVNIITKKGDKLSSMFVLNEQSTSFLPQAYADGVTTFPADPLSLVDRNLISASGGHNFGFISIFLSGGFAYDRNGYYYDNSGSVYRRSNAEHIGGDGFASVSMPWKTGSISLNGIYARGDNRLPGPLGGLSPHARMIDDRIQTSLSYHEGDFLSEFFTLDAKLSYTRLFREYSDPDSMWTPFSSDTVNSIYADVSQEWSATDWLSFVYGGSFNADIMDGTTYGLQNRFVGSGFFNFHVSVGDVLTVSPGIRFDYFSDFGPELTYACGLVFHLTPVSSLKASFAKAFRAPTFGDLYYPGYSNPALKPEDGYGGEIGYSLQTREVQLDASAYLRFMVNEIGYGALGPENFDNSLYPGADIRCSWNIIDNFSLKSTATFIYSFDLSGGKSLADDIRVANVPVFKGSIGLSYQSKETVISLDGELTGGRFSSTNNSNPLPAHFLLNTSWRQQLGPVCAMTVALDNILNTQYMVVNNYPMPGISLRWGLELKL